MIKLSNFPIKVADTLATLGCWTLSGKAYYQSKTEWPCKALYSGSYKY
jgi:hypothetical protein